MRQLDWAAPNGLVVKRVIKAALLKVEPHPHHLPNMKVIEPHPYPRRADAVVEEFAGLAVEGCQPISAAVHFDDRAEIA